MRVVKKLWYGGGIFSREFVSRGGGSFARLIGREKSMKTIQCTGIKRRFALFVAIAVALTL
jgi:hypothetical protein